MTVHLGPDRSLPQLVEEPQLLDGFVKPDHLLILLQEPFMGLSLCQARDRSLALQGSKGLVLDLAKSILAVLVDEGG